MTGAGSLYARAAAYAMQYSHDARLAEITLRNAGLPPRTTRTYIDAMVSDGQLRGPIADQINGFYDLFKEASLTHVRSLFDDLVEDGLWRRNRIVIALDPQLWQELGDVEDGDLFTSDVLQYLPLANPYVFFPEPIIQATRNPSLQRRIVGVHLIGLRADTVAQLREPTQMLCSTADPRLDSVYLKFTSVVTDLEGRERMIDFSGKPGEQAMDGISTRVVLPVAAERPLTFAQIAAIAKANWAGTNALDDPELVELEGVDPAADMIALLRRTIATVMYLCCENADIEVRSAPRTAARRNRRRDPQELRPTVYEAGHTVGAAIRRWRIERDTRTAGAPTGRTLKPHPRKGHFHRFRHGPGRTLLSQPRYMPMTYVNAHLDDGETVTVRPVKAD